MNEITYHVGSHEIKAELIHFPAKEDRPEFCSMEIAFYTPECVEVSRIVMIIDGTEAHAKDVLSSIKAAL
jgi:hypothetical protein